MADDNELSGAEAWADASRRMREQQLVPQISNNLYNAATVNPNQAAQHNAWSKALSVPVESVAAYPEDVQRQVKLQQSNPGKIAAFSPVLAQFLTDQNTANIIHDDLHNAQALEQVMTRPPQPAPQANGLADSAMNMPMELAKGLGQSWWNLSTALNTVLGGVPAGIDMLSGNDTASKWWREHMIDPGLRNIKTLQPDQNAGILEKGAHAAGNMMGVISQALTTAPIETAGGVASAATPVMESVQQMFGHGVRAMAVPAVSDAVNTGRNVYEETGDKAAATRAALAQYASSTMGGIVPMSAPGGLLSRLGQGAAAGVATGELSRQFMNANLPVEMQTPWDSDEAIISGLTGSIFGAFGPHAMHPMVNDAIRRTYTETAAAERAVQDFHVLTEASRLAATGEWRNRDQDSFKEFARMVSEHGDMPEVYVDNRVFLQAMEKHGLTVQDLETVMPEVAEQLKESDVTQGDVKIPTEDFLTHVAGTPIAEEIMPELKRDPDGKTFAQAQEFYQGEAERMKEQAATLAKGKTEADAFRESHDNVQKAIEAQLNAAGRATPAANKVQATIGSTLLSRLALREGITPEQAFEKYGPTIIDSIPSAYEAPESIPARRASLLREHNVRTNAADYNPEDSLSQALQAITNPLRKDANSLFAALDYAKANGRDDIAGEALAKLSRLAEEKESDAQSMSTTPGVPESSPKYEKIKANLEKRKADLLAEAEAMHQRVKTELGGFEQTPQFKRWQDDLPIVTDGGNDYEGGPAVFQAYHGTTHPDIEIFKETGNREGYLGEGPYFTTSPDDASANYAGIGPDLTSRIEREKEQISDNFQEDDYNAQEILQDYFDATGKDIEITDDNFEELKDEYGDAAIEHAATARLKGKSEGLMMPVFVKLEKPADTTGRGEDLTYEIKEDENGDIVDESGTLLDWIEATRSLADSYGFDASSYIDALLSDGGDVGMDEAFRLALKHLSEAYDDNGDLLMGGAIFREIAKEAGYDGVVMDADLAFGSGRRGFGGSRIPSMAGVEPGTLHIVPFESNAIKSVFNENPTDNPHILKQEARGGYIPGRRGIALLKDADLSTYLHETGHWALDTYAKIASMPEASPEIKADMGKLLEWFGVDSLEKWHSMSIDEQRPYHEQLARGFESYLMEGKAPSQELAPVFARIRSWMLNIYKSLRNLNVELTDEVRGVFDRMLATDEAIADAQSARVFEPLFKEKPEGMTDEEWNEYKSLNEQATADAIAEMQAKTIKDMKWLGNAKSRALKRLQKEAKAQRDEVEAEVTQDVDSMPVYRLENFLRRGELEIPKDANSRQRRFATEASLGNTKLDIDSLKEMYGDGPAAPWRYLDTGKTGLAGKEGLPPEMVADLFGFGSADEMVRALLSREPRESMIEGLTDKRMLEEHGEVATPEALDAAANEAISNEARARFVATGLKVLTKSPISARALAKGAREAADTAIARKKVGDLNPRQYEAQEARSNKEALAQVAKDPMKAALAQRASLVNNQLAKSARQAIDDVKAAVEYAKSFDKKSKRLKIDVEEREIIDGLLQRFDFRQVPPEGPTKKQIQLAQWVDSQKALGYTPLEIPDMLNPEVRMHYKEMTVEQLRGLMDTIKSIEKIGRERKTVAIEGKRMDVTEAVQPMLEKMKERGEKFTDAQLAEKPRLGVDPFFTVTLSRLGSILRAGISEFLRPDYKGNKYDMHEILGPMQRGVIERLIGAAYKYGDMQDEVGQVKRARVAEYGLDKDWQKSLTDIVEDHNLMDNSLGFPAKRRLTRGDLIGIAMHVGNESNFDKLVNGMRWAPEEIWKTLHDNMGAKDWLAAKLMGELAGLKWDEMAAMNKRLGNDNPDKIEPRPFKTKFGDMPGWYAPINYDPARSKLGARKAEAKSLNPEEGLFGREYYRADTTTNGSLNSRASGYYDFIDLDFRPLEKRISDTMRDLAYREALLDVHKIITHKEFKQQFQRTYGPEEYKHLGDWLGRLVNGEVGDEKQSVLTSISAASRRAMVANGVAFRISTMLKHGGSAAFKSTGYFAGGGEKFFAQRVAAMATNYSNEVNEALAKFPEIRQRLRQQDRDYGIAVQSIFQPEGVHGKAERFGHAGVAWLDFLTAVPTANAAYDWAITNGVPKRLGGTGQPMSHADAVKFASKIVREAHGSTNEASQSLLINNKSEIVKMLTTLHGFMNNAFGQTTDALDKVLNTNGFGRPELLARVFMAQIVPAIMAGWVTFGGPKDDESWLGWAFHHIGGEFAGMLPMVREGWSAVVEGHESAGAPAWIRALSDLWKPVGDVVKNAEGKEVKHPIKDVGNAAGLFIPGMGQAGATTQFLVDVSNGEQEPRTVADWIRGVMSGKAEK